MLGRVFDRVSGPMIAVLAAFLGVYYLARVFQRFIPGLRDVWRMPFFPVLLASSVALLAILVLVRYVRTRDQKR